MSGVALERHKNGGSEFRWCVKYNVIDKDGLNKIQIN